MKLFITGKLAYGSLCRVLETLKGELDYRVIMLNISVAALMDTQFIAKNLRRAGYHENTGTGKTEIIIPGRCRGELGLIEAACKELGLEDFTVERGPVDLRDIPEYFGFGHKKLELATLPRETSVIAEIADAPLLRREEVLERARYYLASGADIVDIGCLPGENFPHLEETVKAMKEERMKVSIDSLKTEEITRAVRSGADMILSINSTNLAALDALDAPDAERCIPVVIPDINRSIDSLLRNIEAVERHGCENYIIDPILDPIGFGFRDSLDRFIEVEKRIPDRKKLMGVGNIIELTDGDSTGLNALLAGFIVESGIEYVLTTEASNRTWGSVKELDLALRMMTYAVREKVLPKGIAEDLLTVKQEVEYFSGEEIRSFHAGVKDTNFRIFIDGSKIHLFNRDIYLTGEDPDEIFSRLPDLKDSSHAFYLGRELEKARTALLLKKRYRQDDPQEWGYLNHHAERSRQL
jgi:dihydropteroate synthase-like protein